MKLIKIALVAGALAAGVAPSTAFAKPTYHPGGGPPEHPTPPPHGKAYGVYCRGASKEHVKGKQGTEFSRCVNRMEKAAKNDHMPPGQVCKGLSKEHVKGQQGTPFSTCVKGVAQMRKDKAQEEA